MRRADRNGTERDLDDLHRQDFRTEARVNILRERIMEDEVREKTMYVRSFATATPRPGAEDELYERYLANFKGAQLAIGRALRGLAPR
ncbi:MAG: hypothetical protein Kow00129_05330 [Thermoleophilia bacterium]